MSDLINIEVSNLATPVLSVELLDVSSVLSVEISNLATPILSVQISDYISFVSYEQLFNAIYAHNISNASHEDIRQLITTLSGDFYSSLSLSTTNILDIINSLSGNTYSDIYALSGAIYSLQQDLLNYAHLSGANFYGDIYATNLSGINTGDQELSGYAEKTFVTDAISSHNTTGNSHQDIRDLIARDNNILSAYAPLSGANFFGDIFATNLTGTNTGDQDLSLYVPYTNATSSVDLGSYNLSSNIINANTIILNDTDILSVEQHDTLSNLVAHYKMNDNDVNTTLIDSTGNYNGSINVNTNTISVSGQINTALDFSSGIFASVPYNTILAPSVMTVSLWFKTTVDGVGYKTILKINKNYSIGLHNNIPYVSNGGLTYVYFGAPMNDGNWHHLVFIRNNGVAIGSSVYLDGVKPVSDFTFTDSSYIDGDMLIARNLLATPGKDYSGQLDDIRIYNRLLAGVDVLHLYNNGNGTEDSITTLDIPDTKNITLSNAVFNFETSATFNGTLSASNLSGINTGDQDLSSYALSADLYNLSNSLSSYALQTFVTSSISEHNNSELAHDDIRQDIVSLSSEFLSSLQLTSDNLTEYITNVSNSLSAYALSSDLNDLSNSLSAYALQTFTTSSISEHNEDPLAHTTIRNSVTNLTNSLSSYELTANKGQNNGYAPLDSGGKVPLQNLPSTLLKYIGTWDASGNFPTLSSPSLTSYSGYVYAVSVSGHQFDIDWSVGDWAIYNVSGIIEKSDNSDDVKSVNSQTGIVVLTTDNISDTSTNRYTNDSDINRLATTSGNNTGDQNLDHLATYTSVTSSISSHNIANNSHQDIRTLITNSTSGLSAYAQLSGANFFGNITALNLSGINTGDQELSGYATTSSLSSYATQTFVTSSVSNHNLSNLAHQDLRTLITNSTSGLSSYVLTDTLTANYVPYSGANKSVNLDTYTLSSANIVNTQSIITSSLFATGPISASNLSGTNTGDQDLSSYATTANLIGLATETFVTSSLSTHNEAPDSHQDIRDLIYSPSSLSGYAQLSGANFFGNITALNLSGINTGDQELSGYATTSSLSSYATITFVTSSISSIAAPDMSQYAPLSAANFFGAITSPSLCTVNLSSTNIVNTTSITTSTLVALGNITAANLSGINTGDQDLSSYATTASITNLSNSLSAYATLSGSTFNGEIKVPTLSAGSYITTPSLTSTNIVNTSSITTSSLSASNVYANNIEYIANKTNELSANVSTTLYPTTSAVKNYVDIKDTDLSNRINTKVDILSGYSVSQTLSSATVLDHLHFNPIANVTTVTSGTMLYDLDEGTISFGVPNGSIQVGKETFDYYTNLAGVGVTLVDGDVVSIVGVAGNRQAVALTDIRNSQSATACIGMVTDGAAPNEKVRVTKIGEVHNLNTDSFTEGLPVYIDTNNPGKLTQTPPSAPNTFVHVGMVLVKNQNTGIIDVNIKVSPRMQDLSDVNGFVLSANGQFPTYHDGANGYFDFDKNINDYALSATVNNLSNSLSSYVPYTGANQSVDLGSNNLSANEIQTLGQTILAKDSGNVLIGTTTDDGAKLQVVGDDGIIVRGLTQTNGRINASKAGGLALPLILQNNNSTANVSIGSTDDDMTNKLQVLGDIRIGNVGASAGKIQSADRNLTSLPLQLNPAGGNVLIGTASVINGSTDKLQVLGSALIDNGSNYTVALNNPLVVAAGYFDDKGSGHYINLATGSKTAAFAKSISPLSVAIIDDATGNAIDVAGNVNIVGDLFASNLSASNSITTVSLTSNTIVNTQTIRTSSLFATGPISASNLSGTNTGDQDLTIFTPTSSLSASYVPYVGATQGLNLGSYDLSASNLEDFKSYSGFENRTDSALSIDAGGVVTLSGTSFNVYTKGTGKHTLSGTHTVTVTADQTLSYIYVNSSGVLSIMETPWDLTSGLNAPCAIVFKDGTNYALTDERHSFERNKSWHYWAHSTIGAMYKSGFTGTFTTTTMSVTQGVIADEDILFDSLTTKTATTLWYRNATSGMRMIRNSAVAKGLTAGNILAYDNGSGTLQPITNNRYATNWVYATNDPIQPIYTVIGQGDYSNITNARNALSPTINLSTAEWKLIYRVIYQRTAGTPTGVFTEATDFRTVQTGVPTAAVSTDHASLINRDAPSSHPAAAISYDNSLTSATLSSTTVQTAIDELANEFATTISLSAYALPTKFNSTVTTGTSSLQSIPAASNNSCFWNYCISGDNSLEAGQIMSVWSGSEVKYNIVATDVIGIAPALTLQVSLSSNNILLESVVTSGTWYIKGSKMLL